MNPVVIYKTKYGSTKSYAQWIGEELNCPVIDVKNATVEELDKFDTVIYGGGLYAEVINGVHFITKNFEKFSDKKIVIYSTGITPIECRDYYDKLVLDKNFKPEIRDKIKVFNFLGKMIVNELSLVQRTALKTLKKIMSSKEKPTEMEKLLIDLCDVDADLTDRHAIQELISYVKDN